MPPVERMVAVLYALTRQHSEVEAKRKMQLYLETTLPKENN